MLLGRLAALKFKQLDGDEQCEALAMVKALAGSIRAHAYAPWLCPVGEAFSTVEEEDKGCAWVHPVADGELISLAVIDCRGRELVASGDGAGDVRLLDLDKDGDCVYVLSGHRGAVLGVAAIGSLESARGILVASGSFDGTIRLSNLRGVGGEVQSGGWGLPGPEDGSALVAKLDAAQVFEGPMHWVRSVDLYGDGDRVVAGVEWMDNVPDESTGGRKQFAAVVWYLQGDLWTSDWRGLGGGGDPSAQTEKARHVALRGHTNEIYAVRFVRDGQLVVSCSRDETVCIW